MNLIDHYNSLYKEAIQEFHAGKNQVDNLLDSPTDNRFGITLLIRPDSVVKEKIQAFLLKLKEVEPDQYYYPSSDIHVTVLSIISCYEGFSLSNISVANYVRLIKKSIAIKEIDIEFRGITASPSCIMVQGFVNNNSLNTTRNNLRENFKRSGLQQTIDQRYQLETAHSTVVRFRKALTKKAEFIDLLEEYRNYSFGSITVDHIYLVFNDWYQRKEHVKELYQFKIPPAINYR